jgi:hypothetical protein
MCLRLALPVVEASIFVLRSRGEAARHLFKRRRFWNKQKIAFKRKNFVLMRCEKGRLFVFFCRDGGKAES